MPAGADSRPLEGTTVLVTRSLDQSESLAGPLRALGATVIPCPLIAIVPPGDWGPADEAIDALGRYDWVVLTSTNAVERFLARIRERGSDPLASLAAVRVAAVGSSTAERLERAGRAPDLVPDDFRAEGLIAAFREMGAGPGWRVLVPRALAAREIMPETLREFGATVDVVPVYETHPAEPDPAVLAAFSDGEIDVVTLTSPSTVRHLVSFLGKAGLDAAAVLGSVIKVSIGPVTSDELRRHGLEPDAEASTSTVEGLVAALVDRVAPDFVIDK